MYKPLLESMELSRTAVDKFHSQFNNGQYREIYLNADTSFKKNTKESDFIELLESVKRKIGSVISKSENGIQANGFESSGITVNVQFKTKFTDGEASEQFVWIVKNKEAKLGSYTITSPELIKK